jgi:hypothetical protein
MSGANPHHTLSLTKGEADPDYSPFANAPASSAKLSASPLDEGERIEVRAWET